MENRVQVSIGFGAAMLVAAAAAFSPAAFGRPPPTAQSGGAVASPPAVRFYDCTCPGQGNRRFEASEYFRSIQFGPGGGNCDSCGNACREYTLNKCLEALEGNPPSNPGLNYDARQNGCVSASNLASTRSIAACQNEQGGTGFSTGAASTVVGGGTAN